MEILTQVFAEFLAALGRVLLWTCSVLVLEELTLGGLARLLLSLTSDFRGRQRGKE